LCATRRHKRLRICALTHAYARVQGREVARKLGSDFVEREGDGHFQDNEYDFMWEKIAVRLRDGAGARADVK
jgi:hypothetical protein